MNNDEARNAYEIYLNRRYGDRSTPQHYLSDLKIFLATVNQKVYTKIDSRDVDLFVADQQRRGMSAATINRRLAALHTFFETMAAIEPETTQANPVIWRRHSPKQGQPIARDATDAEVTALFEQIDDPRDQAIFGLMVGAGLRVGEVAALAVSDLHPPSDLRDLARVIVRGKGQKERVVWLTSLWYDKVVAYQQVRPESADPHLFLNHRGRGISVNGIQFRLQDYCRRAEVTLTCHQLRHTFARRLADQNMPIESISQLLGHSQIETTQRYTAGANPTLQAEFQRAMAQLDLAAEDTSLASTTSRFLRPARQHHPADVAELQIALSRYASFPEWLRPVLESHLTTRWHNWKAHTAAQNARRTSQQIASAWHWILNAFDLGGWDELNRSHLETWMNELLNRGVKAATVVRYHTHVISVLHFVQERDLAPLHPQLFRIKPPAIPDALPRHLNDTDYRKLLQTVLEQTEKSPTGLLQRTWFLTLAFTGIRLSELLDLRLSDLDLASGRLIIQDSKNQEGRVAFLTPALIRHLQSYLAWRPPAATDHLFVTEMGEPLTPPAIRYCCRQWGIACDLQLSPHRLRHTFATRLVNHGVSLESIRRLLGHRTLHMTQRYARLHASTIRQHFEEATALIEGIHIPDWPHHDERINVYIEHSVNSM